MGLPRICGCPELTNVGRRVCTEFVMQMMGADVFMGFFIGNAVSNFVVCLAQDCRARRPVADGDRFRA